MHWGNYTRDNGWQMGHGYQWNLSTTQSTGHLWLTLPYNLISLHLQGFGPQAKAQEVLCEWEVKRCIPQGAQTDCLCTVHTLCRFYGTNWALTINDQESQPAYSPAEVWNWLFAMATSNDVWSSGNKNCICWENSSQSLPYFTIELWKGGNKVLRKRDKWRWTCGKFCGNRTGVIFIARST